MSYQVQETNSRRVAADIASMLIERIRQGEFQSGDQLPSVRKLASQLGVNKNTVSRVYQDLDRRGYVTLVQGSGTFVQSDKVSQDSRVHLVARKPGSRARPVARKPGDSAAQSHPVHGNGASVPWETQVERIVRNLSERGMDGAQIRLQLDACVARALGEGLPALGFIECNEFDIETLGAHLRKALGHRFDSVILHEFLLQPDVITDRYDLLVTTFFHLSEVEKRLAEQARRKVVAINAVPTQEALLDIARLQAEVIGVVADLPRVADWLIHIVQTYQRSATLLQSSIEDTDRLQILLDKADAIVVTQSRYERLLTFRPQVPVVPVSLTVMQESIEYLEGRLHSFTHALSMS